jgi:hypothetical protein
LPRIDGVNHLSDIGAGSTMAPTPTGCPAELTPATIVS